MDFPFVVVSLVALSIAAQTKYLNLLIRLQSIRLSITFRDCLIMLGRRIIARLIMDADARGLSHFRPFFPLVF